MSELKPCPFCGDDVDTSWHMDESLFSHAVVKWHYIGCGSCDYGMNDENEHQLISKWNARASSPDPAREALQDCAEALAFALAKLGVCGEGDGKDHRADAECPGGIEALRKARAVLADPAREVLVGALKELLKFADTTSSLETEWERAVDHAQKVIALAEQGHKGGK